MAGRKSDFTLTKLDDLFSTQEQRDEEKLSKIRDIPLTEIDDFPDHPFKVRDDEDMAQLIESIKERGVITPATVRQKEDGRYELISGHRRKRACELAGFDTLRCEVVELNRDEATILMVDSNCQRENLSLMEKARSYRMKAEALSHQGKTLGQNVPKSDDNRTTAKIGAESGDNYKTVQRLIRLTYLVPELQAFVDSGKMKMLPAYELSFLNEDAQRDVIDRIDETESFPSHAQARRVRAAFEEGKLDYDTVAGIMAEVKPNQVEKLKIPMNDIRKYVPSSMTPAEMLEYLLKLVKKEYDRQHSRDAR